MELEQILHLLAQIKGCTFASLDSETFPKPGIRKVTIGEQVMLFTNKGGSGYEGMVQRRLVEAGKDADNFVLGDLAWGERIEGTPLIFHRGKHYLQVIQLVKGVSIYYIGQQEIPNPSSLFKERRTNQGLGDNPVVVETYGLNSITKLVMFGETVTARDKPRATLTLKY